MGQVLRGSATTTEGAGALLGLCFRRGLRSQHYGAHERLRSHLADFVNACEYICRIWTKEPERFTLHTLQKMPGLNN